MFDLAVLPQKARAFHDCLDEYWSREAGMVLHHSGAHGVLVTATSDAGELQGTDPLRRRRGGLLAREESPRVAAATIV
ncbi:MAG: hypothetical protein IT541_06180 [Hyphomicrobiales bacterium]|nr:hypothetical protein [Hyphomicrobiales bacterium]